MSDFSMSRSNYLKIMYGDLSKKISSLSSKSINQIGDTSFDVAALSNNNIVENNQAIENAKKYNTPTEGRNGWQRFWDTISEVSNDITEGLLNFGDDLFDFTINVSGEIGNLFGANKSWTKDITSYDWQAQAIKGMTLLNTYSFLTGDAFTKEHWTGWDAETARSRLNTVASDSFLNEIPDDWWVNHDTLKNLGQGIGYMVPAIVAALATGGASAGASASASGATFLGLSSAEVASLTTMGIGAFTGSTNDAYDETDNLGKSMLYGLASASVEVGTELIVGPVLSKAGLGVNKVAGVVGKSVGTGTAKFTKELAKTMFEEGVEEAVSGVLNPVISAIYQGTEAFESKEGNANVYFDKSFWLSSNEGVLAQGFIGASMGGIMGGGQITRKYRALGSNGVNIENLLQENRSLYEEMSKYEPNSVKYNEIAEKMATNTAKISGYYAIEAKKGNKTHLENIRQLLCNPQEFYDAITSEDGTTVTNLVESRLEEMKSPDKFGTRNLFNDLQAKFDTDYQLEFSELPDNINAKVNNDTKTIIINSKHTGTLAPALVHEYIGHVIGDNISSESRNGIFEKVVETDWFKKNNSKLRKAYQQTQGYKKLSAEQKSNYWRSEVINNYIQSLFTSNTNSKSTKMINDVFLRNTLLKRFALSFKKNETRAMLKDNVIIKEFSQSIDKLFRLTNKNVHDVFNKFVHDEKLTESERKVYEKYKAIFDTAKQLFQVEKYSKGEYNKNTKKGERSDEFRRIQEESRRVSEQRSWQERVTSLDENLLERLSRIFEQEIHNWSSSHIDDSRILKNTGDFKIIQNVDGTMFHDVFEIARTYLKNGELVDLHDNYDDATCYLSSDGLSGFAITKDGDLISVFNLNFKKKGFLRSISSFIRNNAKTLDCYVLNNDHNLKWLYETAFGFKTAVEMEYNMDFDHDDIAKNHNKPNVAYMVNTNKNVKTKYMKESDYKTHQEFTDKAWDNAIEYRNKYLESNSDQNSSENIEETRNDIPAIVEKQNTEKNSFKDNEILKPYETNKANEIKDGAKEKEGKVVSLKSVNDLYNEIEKSISEMVGENFKIDGKSLKARRLFEEFNILKNSAKKAACKKFVTNILDQDFISSRYIGEGQITYREYLESQGMNVDEMLEQGTDIFFELLNEKAIDSNTTKKIERLNQWMVRYHEAKADFKAVMQFVKQLNTIKKNIGQTVKKYGNTGQLDLNSGIKGLFNSYFSKFRFTKGQYLSLTNMKNLQQMVQDGSFNALIDSVINPNNEVSNLPELINLSATIKDMALDLANSRTTNQKHLSYQQVIDFNNLNKSIYKLYKDFTSGVLESARENAEVLIERGKKVRSRRIVNGVTNTTRKLIFDALSPRDIIAYMVGGTDTKEFKMIYDDLYKKPYERQIDKYVDFLKMRDEHIKNIKKQQYKKIKVDGIRMYKYVLYQFYLNSLSPDNTIRMRNSNLSFTSSSGTTQKVSYKSLLDTMNTQLTEAEKADLDAIFALYNGQVKTYVENMSEKILGFKVSRDNYYPIVSSDAFKIKDFSNPSQMRFNINALNNGRLKKLSNRKTVIEINVNPINLFNSYIESMTITGEIGLESQKLNRLFQLKNSDGESFSTIVNEYLPDAQKVYIPSIFNKLIGNTNTIERSSMIDRLCGKFATATLGFNIRSMLKQVGSYFTAWGKVGFTTGLKTTLNPTSYLRIMKNRSYLKANNPVFKLRIYDNGFVRGSTLSAGAQAFTSDALKKAVDFSLKGMEMMDRFTCYSTFALCEEYVKKTNGYKIGTEDNLKLASEMFSDVILETQSNSDRIAMSRIRSGEKGVLFKNLFGLFQSDSQNKASQIFTGINDLINTEQELKQLKKDLSESKLDETRVEIQNEIKRVNKARSSTYTRMGTYACGIVLSALVTTLADMLADWLYDKKDPEDEKLSELALQILSNSTLEWIPYFNQLANWIQYDGVEVPALGNINELLQTIKLFTDGNISSRDMGTAGLKILKLLGIPVDNLSKLYFGIIGNFNPEESAKKKSLLYGLSQSYLSQQTNEYIQSGNITKAKASMKANYAIYKFEINDELSSELIKFKKNGLNISIKNSPTYLVDDKNEQVDLTDKQIIEFKKIYSQSSDAFLKLKRDSNYQSLSMEEKSKAVKKLSDTYYEIAKYKTTGIQPSSLLAKYYAYASDTTTLTRDLAIMNYLNVKLAESKNKKDTLLKELNKIKGLSKTEKLLISQMMRYKVSDTNKSILSSYLKSKGIEKSLIEKLLNE